MSTIYTRPSENVAGDVTPSLDTGTADSDYPVTNVNNGDPAVPFMTSDSVGVDLVWDFTAAQRVDLISIPMHGIPAATDVRIQGNATDSWGAPTVDTAVTIATYGADGFPLVAYADITADGGYSAGGFRFWRLHVPSHAGVSKIGDVELWSQKRTLTNGLRLGVELTRKWKSTVHERVDGGRLVYNHALKQRRLRGRITAGASDMDNLAALWRDANGPTNAFLVNESALPEPLYVWWSGDYDEQHLTNDIRDVMVDWPEVGRGLVL